MRDAFEHPHSLAALPSQRFPHHRALPSYPTIEIPARPYTEQSPRLVVRRLGPEPSQVRLFDQVHLGSGQAETVPYCLGGTQQRQRRRRERRERQDRADEGRQPGQKSSHRLPEYRLESAWACDGDWADTPIMSGRSTSPQSSPRWGRAGIPPGGCLPAFSSARRQTTRRRSVPSGIAEVIAATGPTLPTRPALPADPIPAPPWLQAARVGPEARMDSGARACVQYARSRARREWMEAASGGETEKGCSSPAGQGCLRCQLITSQRARHSSCQYAHPRRRT